MNKSEHSTVILVTSFHKPPEKNPYVRFEYGPQKIYKHTRGQVSVSTNADPITANKQVNNQQSKYED